MSTLALGPGMANHTPTRYAADVDISELVKALRIALGLTQDQLAEAGGLTRVEVSHLETGKNKATSNRIRQLLARAAAVQVDDINAYLDGDIHLEALMVRRGSSRSPDRNDASSSRSKAVAIMAEGGTPPSVLAAVLLEAHPPDRTVYLWIKLIEMKEAEHRAAATPHVTPSAPPASPARTTRRSGH